MTRSEAVNWLINITADIGKAEHSELWHYEQALSEIREMLESESERKKGEIIIRSNMLDGEDCYCSECEHWGLMPDYQFCPYCGARMGI